MKSTKKTAVQKKLLDLKDFSGSPVSKTSIAYKNALKVIDGEKSIRPVYTSGSGRFISNQDHTNDTIKLLSKIGIDFKLTNDSPRGGLTGNLITITTKII